MKTTMFDSLRRIWTIEKQERTKIFLVSFIFGLVITSYTIYKEMKDIVFVEIVGADYVPRAKMISIFVLIPAILFYSFMVNRVRRHQILCFYSILYGILGLVFTYLLGHPVIGISNTDTSPWRLFGWIFYIFIEGASPFLIGVVWAFANSIHNPKEAKNYYAFLVTFSRVGGLIGAGFGWYLLSHRVIAPLLVKQQLLLLLPSLVLFLVPVAVWLLKKKVPSHLLHGYEAVYAYEKKVEKSHEQPGLFSGLILLIRNPYVLGIFSIIFFYEMVNTVLSLLRITYSLGDGLEEFSSRLFALTFGYHLVAFFIALLGTQALMRVLGERRCLMLVPISIGVLLFAFLFVGTFEAFTVAFIAMRAINYAFFYPVRESLYIPTVKAINFQSKAWIDAFGTKISKGAGSLFNETARHVVRTSGLAASQMLHAGFFAVIIGLWVLIAHKLGNRYARAIARNEVIGAGEEE